jgi:Tn3 transposase DDE domain
MIRQLSAASIRQAMRWAGDERRLAQACQAVLEFMQRHPIATTWGRSDLLCRTAWRSRQRSLPCVANVDTSLVESHWDALVHLSASVRSGS